MNSAMVMATRIIAPLGATAIAANSFAVTAESFCYMPGYGIGSAATTLVGKSVGAGKPKMAKRYGNICTAMGALFMGFTGLVMMFICPVVFRILTPDATVRELATRVLRIELLAEPLLAFPSWRPEPCGGRGYVYPKPYESRKHLDRAPGPCCGAGTFPGASGHVDRHGRGTLRQRSSDALPSAHQQLLRPFPKAYKNKVKQQKTTCNTPPSCSIMRATRGRRF